MRPQDLDQVGENYITSIIENAGPNSDTDGYSLKFRFVVLIKK